MHQERTGQTVAQTSAASNTRRAVKRADLATAQATVAAVQRQLLERDEQHRDTTNKLKSALDDLESSGEKCRETEQMANEQVAEGEEKCREAEGEAAWARDLACDNHDQLHAENSQRRDAENAHGRRRRNCGIWKTKARR